jgi:hypothetical protein
MLSIRWSWVVSFTLIHFNPCKRAHGSHWLGSLMDSGASLDSLKGIVEKQGGMVWNGFIWLRIGSIGSPSKHGNGQSESIGNVLASWVTTGTQETQGRLSSVGWLSIRITLSWINEDSIISCFSDPEVIYQIFLLLRNQMQNGKSECCHHLSLIIIG